MSFAKVVAAVIDTSGNVQHDRVVRGLRLPPLITAISAGAALGVSGATFQSVSRNALRSPDVIGFTTGATTGAIVQIVVFQAEALQVSIGAVAGGLLTAMAVYVLPRRGGVTGGYRLIPTGIGGSAVLGALNGLLLVTGDLDRAFTVTRLLPITAAVPIGRVTGIVAGLYLIWMLTRSKQV